MKPRLLWMTPEKSGGIASYSQALWPALAAQARAEGGFEPLELIQSAPSDLSGLIREAAALRPQLVHIQHEYGLFGGKNPPWDRFPGWMSDLRSSLGSEVRIVATAHTVIPDDYQFEVSGRGWQAPVRWLANRLLLPRLRRHWGKETWEKFDAVVVHSGLQVAAVRQHCGQAVEVPHFVPEAPMTPAQKQEEGRFRLTVFGYFTPEKGQDVVIDALAHVGAPIRLRLAGGVRRQEDEKYLQHCLQKIDSLGLRDRVEVTGFVPDSEITRIYAESDLVIAPFRWTSGSGSLAQALARGAPILASDLALNQEISARVPGALEFFKSEDARDCAVQIDRLLSDAGLRDRMREGARRYAQENSPVRTAQRHLEFYRRVLSQEARPGAGR
jgi:glycosyltransferase involved in cell wall biosynthesis